MNLLRIESDHNLPVNHRDRRGHEAELFEFGERGFIGRDIALDKTDLLLGKKLFHLAAEHSTGLGINDHSSDHRTLSFASIPSRLIKTP